ncbi:hypothetical protein IAQ61_007900 [Plenodomus lingam]|uniref:Predicted protein n=1 Tax=Leptosphaeria maculans (strain JN3 / isolate v23.1.3 / race Av1-4-5-6-7-8) TaxID=985895 RepID=E4ZZQ1_LEPMJ|nr:predicted protein [Plenodomus lingam JN3]KAH9867308.1 hypothetical protein IAQ61_007900 [Plenodomus lingam]CBX97167.1 predicted protein [Plenodomus lingam JN3]
MAASDSSPAGGGACHSFVFHVVFWKHASTVNLYASGDRPPVRPGWVGIDLEPVASQLAEVVNETFARNRAPNAPPGDSTPLLLACNSKTLADVLSHHDKHQVIRCAFTAHWILDDTPFAGIR